MKIVFGIIIISSLFISTMRVAEAIDPNLLKFCTIVPHVHAEIKKKDYGFSLNDGVNVGGSIPIKGIPFGIEFGVQNSHSSRHISMEQLQKAYYERNCDSVLRMRGRVTIAEINANRDVAIHRLKMQQSRYQQDTLRAIKSIEAATQNRKTQAWENVQNRKTQAWENVNLDRNRTDFNSNLVNQSSNTMNTLVNGASNYLITDRQSRTQELQDSIRNEQMYYLNKRKSAQDNLKKKFKY